jgi:SSS family solute:Na+ symporter
MLSLWSNGNTWRTYIIGTILGQLFFMPMNQAGCQCSISAKNVRTMKRSIFLAVPLNCIFGIFMIAFGMAAATLPKYADYYGTPLATFAMLVDLLPTWVVIWLLAGFAAAILSTVAVCVLGISTVFTDAIIKTYYKPDMTDKQYMRFLRGCIIIFASGACVVSTLMPAVNTSMVWLNAWLLPAFWMFVFGMHWKRSSKAALTTIIVSAVANCIWTFGDFGAKLRLDNNNSLVMLFFTLLVGLITTATDKNALPGLISLYKRDKARVVGAAAGR